MMRVITRRLLIIASLDERVVWDDEEPHSLLPALSQNLLPVTVNAAEPYEECRNADRGQYIDLYN